MATDRKLEELAHLWDQYKYRHELCWSAVYKVTVAVLALEIVPFAKDALTAVLGYWMLLPPLLGTVLSGFGILLVANELEIFASVKLAFHVMQNAFLDKTMPDVESREAAKHRVRPCDMRQTRFDQYVKAFMIGLFVMSALNTVFVIIKWIPRLTGVWL